MHSSDELFQRSREGYFGVYFPSCEATREIINKITLEWAQNQFTQGVHTLFLTRQNVSINYDKNDNFYTSSPCLSRSLFVLLMTSQSIAGDVTMTTQYGPVTMIVSASGHQIRCLPWVQMGTFNKKFGFLCGSQFFALKIFCGEYLQWSLHLMLQIWWRPLLWNMCQ